MKALISIVIVNWNSKDDLKECLESLSVINYKEIEIILVDNASKDDSLQFVKKNFPKVAIVKSDKNLGFAGGNNLGFKKCNGKYVLFLNNDTITTEDFLTPLVKFMEERTDVGIVQPKILFHRPGTSLHQKINSVGSFLLNTGFLYHLDYGKPVKNMKAPYEIFSAYGACFLVRKKVIDKVGLFDTAYFAYFEETDFCHRVWLSGWKVMVFPGTCIYHKGAKTAKRLPTAFIQYHSFKNRLFTYLKNFDNVNLIKIFIPHLLICEISSLLYLLFLKPDYTLAIQKAIFWNLLNFGKIKKDRQKVQREIRKISDRQFIPKLTKNVGIGYYYYLSSGALEGYRK